MYVVLLMLISSYILIIRDRREMKSKNLKKEARFAFVSGITYAIIAVIIAFLQIFLPL
jgi:hypothetical protein